MEKLLNNSHAKHLQAHFYKAMIWPLWALVNSGRAYVGNYWKRQGKERNSSLIF